jgi:predicted lipoprotein with Yx(FWY)xxD motif
MTLCLPRPPWVPRPAPHVGRSARFAASLATAGLLALALGACGSTSPSSSATSSHSACTGSCLSVWPPVEVGGHQVVVNGHPAYTFSGDAAPGQVNGQGLQDTWGKWWALGPGGVPITTSKPSSTTSGSSYGYGGY